MKTLLARVYGITILVSAGVFVWTAFDIHNRLPYTMLAQVPMLVVWAIVQARKL